MTRRENSGQIQLVSVSVKSFVLSQSSRFTVKMYFGSLTSLCLKVCKKLQTKFRLCISIAIYNNLSSVHCVALCLKGWRLGLGFVARPRPRHYLQGQTLKSKTKTNHRRAVAQPCVNGDRLSKGRMAKFDPAQIRNPSTDRHKI